MTVRELINDLNENFQDMMDCEVFIAINGRGSHKAMLPVGIKSSFAEHFVTIPVKGLESEKRLSREYYEQHKNE